MVRVLGDITGLGKSFDDASTSGTGAAARLHSAFSGVLGQLNTAGVLGPFGQTLSTIEGSLDSIGKHGKTMSETMMGVGGTMLGVGLGLQAAASGDERAHAQLQAAVSATGHNYDQYAAKVDAAIKHQENFGHTASQTQDALRILTQATNDPAKALEYMNTVSDLAAAKHEDLSSAAEQVARAYNGAGKVMKEFGITLSATSTPQKELTAATKAHETATNALSTAQRQLLELQTADAASKSLSAVQTLKLQDAQAKVVDAQTKVTSSSQALAKAQHDVATGTGANTAALDELGKKLSGQAQAQADTFSGHIAALKAHLEDAFAHMGEKYGPAITALGAGMSGLSAAMTVGSAAVNAFKDGGLAASLVTRTWTVVQGAFNLVMDANPIVLVILAVVALTAAIILAYTHSKTFRDVIDDMGKVVAAAFRDIYDAGKAVFDWMANNWPLLLAILAGPFGLATLEIIKHWADLEQFFRGLAGDIAGIFTDIWRGVSEGFRHALNALIDLWNDLHFTLPDINFGPIHLGGETIGVPAIPHLAQGGVITHTGLIYAHAGEAITPAAAAGVGGPAVVIQRATFAHPVDIDVFLAKASFAMRAGKA